MCGAPHYATNDACRANGLGGFPMTLHNLVVEISEPIPGKTRGDCPVAGCLWHLYADPNIIQRDWEKHARSKHRDAQPTKQGRLL